MSSSNPAENRMRRHRSPSPLSPGASAARLSSLRARPLLWLAIASLLAGFVLAQDDFDQDDLDQQAQPVENEIVDEPAAAAGKTYQRPVLIRLEGPVLPMSTQFLRRRLDRAKELDADLLIVEIDSPGGLVEESFDLANRLRTFDGAHTVVYVPRQALSGAAIMALGADEIVMHPDARLGDAGPIVVGEDALFRHAPEKIVSDLAVRIRELAESKGRPPALAEAMVDRDLAVYRTRNLRTGETAYLSDAEIADSAAPNEWEKEKLVFESRADHFLEATGRRAFELGLAEAIVDDFAALEQRYDLGENLVRLEQTWVDALVYVLNHPVVTTVLFIVGLIALYIEFSAPGIGVGAFLAGVCFLLFFWSRYLSGTADWLELLLFLAGVGCLGLELFVLPGFGVAGLTGVLLILASIVLAGQTFFIPRTAYDLRTLTTSLGVCVVSGGVFFAVAWALRGRFGSLPVLRGMMVEPPLAVETNSTALVDGEATVDRAALIGRLGVAFTALRPAGKARFGQQMINVVADGEFISPGARIRVIDADASRVMVVADDE